MCSRVAADAMTVLREGATKRMGYVARLARVLTKRARSRYRYRLYWAQQERIARRWSGDKLAASQWERFDRLLSFVYDRIPFYRDRLRAAGVQPSDIRGREDLCRLPVTTKDDIRRNFPDRILNPDRSISPLLMGQTSGSTSESVHFVRPGAWERSLYYSVFLRTGGISNLPVLVLATPHCTAATCSLDDSPDNATWFSRLQSIPFLRHLDRLIDLPSSENILGARDDYMEGLREEFERYGPCILIADPVYLAAFARYVLRVGAEMPDVRHIITTYELLTGSLRDLLTDCFGCDITTQYGSSEVNDIANECEHHRLHVRSQHVLLEVLRDGLPAAPGELGRAVVTDLDNYNMPFIRYDIGDVLAAEKGPCPCGRNTPAVGLIQGRVGDLLAVPNGTGRRVVTPLETDEIFRGVAGIAFYQLTEQTQGRYTVAFMPDKPDVVPDTKALTNRFRRVLGNGSVVRFRRVNEIPPQPSMKFRFVHSKVPTGDLL